MTGNFQPAPLLSEIKERFDDCKKHGWLKKWAEWMGIQPPTASKKWSTTESGEDHKLALVHAIPELWACYMADLEFGERAWAVLAYFRNRFRAMYPNSQPSKDVASVNIFDIVDCLVDSLPDNQRLSVVTQLQIELGKKESDLKGDVVH